MKVVFQAHGLPVLLRRDHAAAVETDPAPAVSTSGRWATRCSSSPAEGLRHRHQGRRRRRARRGGRGGQAARPEGPGRGRGGRRSRDRVRGHRGSRRRAAPGQRGRGDPDRRQPRVLRLRGEVPPRGAHRARRPGRPARPPGQAGAGARGGGLRGTLVRGLARVDFFVLPDERVVINEINTMPGFTPSSMFPRMWAASGLDYQHRRPVDPARAPPRHRAALGAGSVSGTVFLIACARSTIVAASGRCSGEGRPPRSPTV